MTPFKTILASAALSLTLGLAPVQADSLSADDQTAMTAAVEVFNTAFAEGDFATVMGAMPPNMKSYIAEGAGITVEALDTAMIEQTKAAMSQVTVESFNMDIAAADYAVTSSNRPYALVPTETVISADQIGKIMSKTATLALKDDGAWYLVRIDDASQITLLTTVFPDFAGIEFPQGTMEPVE